MLDLKDRIIDACYEYWLPVVFGGFIIGSVVFSVVSAKTVHIAQVCDEYTDLSDEDLYINCNGEYCKEFESGEHVLKVYKNSGFKHEYESIDGYTIEKIEFKPYRYRSEVTYVNDEDIIAIGELDKNNYIEFNDFGIVKKLTK